MERLLRQRSSRKSQSLNTTVIETLRRGLGMEGGPTKKKRDLSRYAGTWTRKEFEEFEKSCEVFEQIDLEVWK